MMIRVCLIILCLAFAASAATFNVTKTDDTLDGFCDADCSLREAITAANLLAGDDVIIVPPGIYTTTIATTNENGNLNGDFDISGNVRIVGEGQGETIVQANAAPGVATDRVFHILGTATKVVIEKLTVRHGRTINPAGTFRGGGIRNEGDLTLRNVNVTDNQTIARGGGITSTNPGTALSLDRVNVTNNQAVSTTVGTFGGGVFTNFSTVRIRRSSISNNSSTATVGANLTANGGGFYALDGNVTIRDSSFNGNIVTGTSSVNSSDGGGLRFVGLGGPMLINLDGVTVSNNQITEGGSAGAGISIGTIEGATDTIVANISNSTISSNSVASSVTNPSGAGMIVNGLGRTTVNVENTRFANNVVTSSNPAFRGTGGAIYSNNAVLNLRNSSVSNNSADDGGGIRNDSGPHDVDSRTSIMTIDGTSVENNSAVLGGGILNRASATGVSVPIGGNVILNLKNSTVSSNRATENGGGIYQDQVASTTSQMSIDNSTIAFNQADSDNNSTGDGGGIKNVAGTAGVKNTIVSNNQINNQALQARSSAKSDLGAALPFDLSGAFTSFDYNLFRTTTGATITGSVANSVTGLDPNLLPLSSGGGFGRTHRLSGGSLARNAGDPVNCRDQANNAVLYDQRGLPRAQGGAVCDIGAVEEGGVMWDGGGADNNFSTAENWEGDTVPANTDYVIFSAVSGKNVSVDTSREIRGIIYGGGFTGTMTLNGGSLRVRDRVYLFAGNIVCTTGNVFDMAAGSAFVRGTGYIDGTVNHDFVPANAENFVFHTGTSSGYFPATIDYTPPQISGKARNLGVSTLTVKPNEGTLPGVNPAQSLGIFWTIETSGLSTANLTLSYTDNVVAATADESAFRFIRRENNANVPFVPTEADAFFNTFRLEGVNQFSDWTLGGFVPTAASATISGRVLTPEGAGIRNAIVELRGGSLTAPIQVRTGTFGNFSFPDTQVGQTYVLTVSAKRFTFASASRVIELHDNLDGLQFVSNP